MKILVVGDSCLDTFIFGDIERIAPEAPVPVIKPKYIKDNPGISFRDWYHSKEPTRVIRLKDGGDVESYADLIDAFEKGIDVMPGEDLTKYIRRIRSAELRALMEESQ